MGFSVYLFIKKSFCNQHLGFLPDLYFSFKHLQTQAAGEIYTFMLFRQNAEHAAALFHCTRDPEDNWYSPPAAPFGGIQSDRKCTEKEITFLLNCIKNWVNLFSGKKLTIKTAPSAYDLKMHIFYHKCYINAGFIPERVYPNHFVPVSPAPFTNRLAAAEKRRLRKSAAAKFMAGPDFPVSCKEAYEFIQESRFQKGYAIPVSFLHMQQLLHEFPEHFQIFTVKDIDRIIALSLTVRVNGSVLYNFLSADLCSYRHFSPAVLLLESIYQYCQEQQIRMLDLGISIDENGIHKPSLSRFKQNVGGEVCYKITYAQVF